MLRDPWREHFVLRLAFHFVFKLTYKSPEFSSHSAGPGCSPPIPHECEQKAWPQMELLRELYCSAAGEMLAAAPHYIVLLNANL